jgi:hypothetical protein
MNFVSVNSRAGFTVVKAIIVDALSVTTDLGCDNSILVLMSYNNNNNNNN